MNFRRRCDERGVFVGAQHVNARRHVFLVTRLYNAADIGTKFQRKLLALAFQLQERVPLQRFIRLPNALAIRRERREFATILRDHSARWLLLRLID